MRSIHQLIVRWIKVFIAPKASAPNALRPLLNEELARAIGDVVSPEGPIGSW